MTDCTDKLHVFTVEWQDSTRYSCSDQLLSSGVAGMSKLHGPAIQCKSNTHLLGELEHVPTMNFFLKLYTLRSLLRLFLATNTYHSFSLTRMLTPIFVHVSNPLSHPCFPHSTFCYASSKIWLLSNIQG